MLYYCIKHGVFTHCPKGAGAHPIRNGYALRRVSCIALDGYNRQRNDRRREMASREPDETPEELGRKVASLYRDMSYPSAAKFKAALRKKQINVSMDFINDVVADQSVRQLTAPAPKFTGHVTSRKIDARWMGDLMDYTAKSVKGSPQHVLIIQDVFSRFIFAKALKSKADVTAAFSRIVEETGRKCEELNTDRGSEFTSSTFQSRLRDLGIPHRLKVGPQDLATLDRAIGTLRATLSRRTAEGGTWWEELDAAVKSINNSEHAALFMQEPGEVKDDEDLRFDLRYHNAEMASENQELAKKRGDKLVAKSAFRTLLPLKTGFRRRAGQQNWSEKIHTVDRIESGRVVDTDGNSFPMSTVLPIAGTTVPSAASSFAQGGNTKVDEKRRIALRPWLRDMMDIIRSDSGISINMLSRRMRDKPGFSDALKAQRATVTQAVKLYPEIRIEKKGRDNALFLQSDTPIPRAGTLDAFAS